jgi:hypothetical protein
MIDSRVAAPRVPAELVCWAQTALLLVPPELGVADDSGLEVALFHPAWEALRPADHAPDSMTQWGAVADVYAQLVQQAVAWRRISVPKVSAAGRSP